MDFRIRNIKNHETAYIKQDPVVSILKELSDLIKLSNKNYIETQREREETRSAFETITAEMRRLCEKTVESLERISQKIITDKEKKSEEYVSINAPQVVHELQITEKRQSKVHEKDELLKKVEQITLAPVEPRSVEIMIKQNQISKNNTSQRMNQIKSYIGKVSKKIFSVSFNMFFKEKIDYEKIKTYCSENLLGNIIEVAQREKITAKQIQMIDEHLSQTVLPYIKLNYPHSEEKQTSSKLANIIIEKDIFNLNHFDIIYNSPLKKLTWYDYKNHDQKNDKDQKTAKEVMRMLNYIIQLPNQKTKVLNSQLTLFEQFQSDMTKCFSIIFNKNIVDYLKLNFSQKKTFVEKEKSIASPEDLCQYILNYIQSKHNTSQNQPELTKKAQKEAEQYEEKVKSYTKIKIGRKISPNTLLYTASEIEKGDLRIKDSPIRRIIVKWIQNLEQIFQNPSEFAILRNQLIMLNDGSQNSNQGLKERQLLLEIIKKQSIEVKQTYRNMKKNMYETLSQCIMNKQFQGNAPEFCSQRQAALGNLSVILSRASQSYIIDYLVTLINSLKKVEYSYFLRSVDLPQNQKKPLLVNLKLGDLMRCQVSSNQNQIVSIYKFFITLCDLNPKLFELVRVKNRFNGPNKDILINFWYHRTIMVQIQLAIKNDSPFLECSDKYSHFIYQLRRDILGPISELTSVWSRFSPKAQFFQKNYRQKLKKSRFNLDLKNNCQSQSHIVIGKAEKTLPFWCTNCRNFQKISSVSFKCLFCKIQLCSICKNTEELFRKYSSQRAVLKYSDITKGDLVQGIQIQSRQKRLYFFIQFMGKLCIFSFKLNLEAFTKIFEEKSEHFENQINFDQFTRKNLFLLVRPKLDKDQLIEKIFFNFFLHSLQKVDKKHVKSFSFIFSSTPKLSQQKRKAVVQKLLANPQAQLHMEKFETLNISQTSIETLSLLKVFKRVKIINSAKNKITNLKDISQMQELRVIFLMNNQISSLESIVLFPSIEQVYLQKNNLTDLKGLQNLPNLRKIYIQNNSLSRMQGIKTLPFLEEISLAKNNLESFEGLPLLPSLKKLQIISNRINTLQFFPNLILLEELSLSKNRVVSLIDLPQLKNLKKLQLSNNDIKSLLGTPELPSLEEIYISNNRLKSFEGLPLLKNLKKLVAEENQINTLCNCPQFPSLEYLSIHKNHLESLQTLESIKSLKLLNVGYNKLKSIGRTLQLPQLEKLYLYFNPLTALIDISQLKSLKLLIVSFNKIDCFEKIDNVTQIEQLICGHNKFTSLKNIPSQNKLKTINFQANQLNTLQGTPDMPFLTQMRLSNNRIQSLKGLPSLSRLKVLQVEKNQIKTFEFTPGLPSLQDLFAHGNKLQNLKGLPTLNNLVNLNLKQNQIRTLQGTPDLPMLEMLILNNNKLDNLDGLPSLTNLKSLELGNNQISSLEEMPNLSSLQQLDLSSNRLQSLKGLPLLTSLKILKVKNNKLNTLQFTPTLPLVQVLQLRKNHLQTLRGLTSLRNLKMLNLSSNQISSLEGMPQLPCLQQLNLVQNKLTTFKFMPQFTSLKKLFASTNFLTDLQYMPQLPELQQLSLLQNKLWRLRGAPLLKNLQKLRIPTQCVYQKEQIQSHFPRLLSLNDLQV